jgi:hypothetical protein
MLLTVEMEVMAVILQEVQEVAAMVVTVALVMVDTAEMEVMEELVVVTGAMEEMLDE